MGRIVAQPTIRNGGEAGRSLRCDAMVDTGSTYTVLPLAWKDRLGAFETEQEIELRAASQDVARGLLCGPVKITIEGFRGIHSEVLFLDMKPADGNFEALLGYIALEQCGAAVDMLGHRLVPVKCPDLK